MMMNSVRSFKQVRTSTAAKQTLSSSVISYQPGDRVLVGGTKSGKFIGHFSKQGSVLL